MKTIIAITLLLIISPVWLLGQANPLDELMEDYSGKAGVYFLDLSTNMIPAACGDEEPESESKMNVKILSIEEQASGLQANELYSSFFSRIDKDSYIGLVEVNSKEENVEILVKKENKEVSAFLIVVREENEISFIAATGNFDLKTLANLKGLQDCRSLKVIGKICGEE